MGLFDKAKDAAAGHEDKVDQATDKGGDFANQKTGGQHADKIEKGQEGLDGALGAGGQDAPPQQ